MANKGLPEAVRLPGTTQLLLPLPSRMPTSRTQACDHDGSRASATGVGAAAVGALRAPNSR